MHDSRDIQIGFRTHEIVTLRCIHGVISRSGRDSAGLFLGVGLALLDDSNQQRNERDQYRSAQKRKSFFGPVAGHSIWIRIEMWTNSTTRLPIASARTASGIRTRLPKSAGTYVSRRTLPRFGSTTQYGDWSDGT